MSGLLSKRVVILVFYIIFHEEIEIVSIIFKMTTNISNLNLSKGTIPPLLKYKIVFLGDQAVGKSSIINRFIYDIFDGNEHVQYF